LGRHWDDRLLRDGNAGQARYPERPILQLFRSYDFLRNGGGDLNHHRHPPRRHEAFSRDNLASADGMLVLGAGVAMVIAVVFYFLALSEGPTSVVVPIYGMFIVGGAVLGLVFLHEPLTLRKALGIPSPPSAFILSQAIRRVETLIRESLDFVRSIAAFKKLKREKAETLKSDYGKLRCRSSHHLR
jgi:hypothetical protein